MPETRGTPETGTAPGPAAPLVEPAPAAVRRALRRVADGRPLDVTEATILLGARGAALDDLLDAAGRVRDAGLGDAGRPGVVTYSRKVFIPLTRLCRDRCHYCTFVTVPHRLAAPFLERDEVLAIARAGAAQGCKEALFTLGDRPEERWPVARQWLEERGYDSTLDYVRACAIAVLEETGLLPHLNPGVHELGRADQAQAGGAEHGHDAGDHGRAVVVGAHRAALRLTGQGAGGTPAGARGRRPGQRAVHHRHPDRHRGDAGRAGRVAVRDPPAGPASTGTSRKSSCRTSGPSRTPRCATYPTPTWPSWPRRSRSRGSCSDPGCGCRHRRI